MIDANDALKTIFDPKNDRRIIWTASILLERLKIGWYPDIPKQEYESAKDVLAELYSSGKLVKRPELHSRFTLRETAYMRPDDTRGRNIGPTAQEA